MENHRFFPRHYLLFPHEVESSYQRLNGLRSDNFKKPGEFFFEFVLCILRKNISSLDPLKKGTTPVVISELSPYYYVPEYRSQQYLEWFELAGIYHSTELS